MARRCPDSIVPQELLVVAGDEYSPLLFNLLGERNGFAPSPQFPSRAGLCLSILQWCAVFPEQVNQWPPLKSLHLVIKSVHLVPYSLGLAGRCSLCAVSTSGTVGARAPSSRTIALPALRLPVWCLGIPLFPSAGADHENCCSYGTYLTGELSLSTGSCKQIMDCSGG